MLNRSLRIMAQREPFGYGVALSAGREDYPHQFVAADQLTFSPITEGTLVNPFLRITNDEAQVLMDELWNCGIRPTEGTGSAGSLAATQKHLEDMRAVAFKFLKIGVKNGTP